MLPLPTLQRFDAFLDVMHPHLPTAVSDAARAFAAEERAAGRPLGATWLNNGPESLAGELPEGWQDRLQPVFSGASLTLLTLGRSDLLKTKLYALCDRGTDILDCVALAPTGAELDEALPWVSERDGNELWPEHCRLTFADLRRRLGHAV